MLRSEDYHDVRPRHDDERKSTGLAESYDTEVMRDFVGKVTDEVMAEAVCAAATFDAAQKVLEHLANSA